jgi:hypothetical protein
MSYSAFYSFEGPDFAAFAIAVLIGYFAGTFAPTGSAASLYITVLISYHLFLAWLVFFSSNSLGDDSHKRAAISLPIGQTLLTHAACLAVILGPIATAVHALPHYSQAHDTMTMADMAAIRLKFRLAEALCGLAAGLAIYERRWLFSAEGAQFPPKPGDAPVAAPSPVLQAASGDDFAEWQHYLAEQKRSARKPGTSLKAEYEQWLLARHRARQTAISNSASSKQS